MTVRPHELETEMSVERSCAQDARGVLYQARVTTSCACNPTLEDPRGNFLKRLHCSAAAELSMILFKYMRAPAGETRGATWSSLAWRENSARCAEINTGQATSAAMILFLVYSRSAHNPLLAPMLTVMLEGPAPRHRAEMMQKSNVIPMKGITPPPDTCM